MERDGQLVRGRDNAYLTKFRSTVDDLVSENPSISTPEFRYIGELQPADREALYSDQLEQAREAKRQTHGQNTLSANDRNVNDTIDHIAY